MEKLQRLMKEVNECVAKVNEETERMKVEHLNNRQEQLEVIVSDLGEFADIIRNLGGSVMVKTKAKRRYYSGIPAGSYYIKLGQTEGRALIFGEDKHTYLGFIPMTCPKYSERNRWFNSLTCNLDEILDKWDRSDFEVGLATEIERVLTDKLKKANREYEKAKEALENDRNCQG